MAYPVTLNGRTYTLADFEGNKYVEGLPDAFEDFVTHAGSIYKTTSTTSNEIGTGSKTFTVEASKPYQVGTPLRITDTAAPSTNWIDAIITSYSGTTLVVDAVAYAGSGTKTAWSINIGGGGTSYTGTLPIAQGGTGATTQAAARTNLGLGTGDSVEFAAITATTFTSTGIDDNATSTALTIDSSGAALLGTTSAGSAGAGDLVVNGGVYLGGTGSANKLDDYEEGTWTPVLQFGVGQHSTGITYSNRHGFYTKVGRMVHITGTITLTSKGTLTGVATINGLPFTAAELTSDTSLEVGGGVSFWYQNISSVYGLPTHIPESGHTYLTIWGKNSATGSLATELTNSNFADNTSFRIGLVYMAQ